MSTNNDSVMHQAKLVQAQVFQAIEEANAYTPAERRITPKAALTVVQRSFESTRGQAFEVREFHAMRELSAYINLAQKNKKSDTYANHTDLLPAAHPSSTRMHVMTASGLAKARTRWMLADDRISDEARPLLATAYTSTPDSIEHKYAITRLTSLPAGSYPLEALVAAYGDGNSSAALSQRAMLQRRDRKGRFAYQGGGMSAFVERLNGVVERITGRVVSQSADGNTVRVELPNGRLVDLPTDGGEFIKAVIPGKRKDGFSGTPAKYSADDIVLNEEDLESFDAPHGFTKDNAYTGPGAKYTDDSYDVVKKADGKFEVSRRGLDESMGEAASWAEVQKLLQDDDENLAKAEGREPVARLSQDQIDKMYDENFDPRDVLTPAGMEAPTTGEEEEPESTTFKYEYPDGAYQLAEDPKHAAGFDDPINDSEDYTDDPAELAQKFSSEALERALQQAISPQAGTTRANGLGDLKFQYKEPIAAEALYLALEEQGKDAKRIVAKIYDAQLGNKKNQDALVRLDGAEFIKAVIPKTTAPSYKGINLTDGKGQVTWVSAEELDREQSQRRAEQPGYGYMPVKRGQYMPVDPSNPADVEAAKKATEAAPDGPFPGATFDKDRKMSPNLKGWSNVKLSPPRDGQNDPMFVQPLEEKPSGPPAEPMRRGQVSPGGDWQWNPPVRMMGQQMPGNWSLTPVAALRARRLEQEKAQTPPAPREAVLPDEIGGGWVPGNDLDYVGKGPVYDKKIDGVNYRFVKNSDGTWDVFEMRGGERYSVGGPNQVEIADPAVFDDKIAQIVDAKQKLNRTAVKELLSQWGFDRKVVDLIDTADAYEILAAVTADPAYVDLQAKHERFMQGEQNAPFRAESNAFMKINANLDEIRDNYVPAETSAPTDEPDIADIVSDVKGGIPTSDEIQAMLDGEGIGSQDDISGDAPEEVLPKALQEEAPAESLDKIIEDAFLGEEIPESLKELLERSRPEDSGTPEISPEVTPEPTAVTPEDFGAEAVKNNVGARKRWQARRGQKPPVFYKKNRGMFYDINGVPVNVGDRVAHNADNFYERHPDIPVGATGVVVARVTNIGRARFVKGEWVHVDYASYVMVDFGEPTGPRKLAARMLVNANPDAVENPANEVKPRPDAEMGPPDVFIDNWKKFGPALEEFEIEPGKDWYGNEGWQANAGNAQQVVITKDKKGNFQVFLKEENIWGNRPVEPLFSSDNLAAAANFFIAEVHNRRYGTDFAPNPVWEGPEKKSLPGAEGDGSIVEAPEVAVQDAPEVPGIPEIPGTPEAPAPLGVIQDIDPDGDVEQQITDAIEKGNKISFIYNGLQRLGTPKSMWTNPKNGNINVRVLEEDGQLKTYTISKMEAPGAPTEVTPEPAQPVESVDPEQQISDLRSEYQKLANDILDMQLEDGDADEIKALDDRRAEILDQLRAIKEKQKQDAAAAEAPKDPLVRLYELKEEYKNLGAEILDLKLEDNPDAAVIAEKEARMDKIFDEMEPLRAEVNKEAPAVEVPQAPETAPEVENNLEPINEDNSKNFSPSDFEGDSGWSEGPDGMATHENGDIVDYAQNAGWFAVVRDSAGVSKSLGWFRNRKEAATAARQNREVDAPKSAEAPAVAEPVVEAPEAPAVPEVAPAAEGIDYGPFPSDVKDLNAEVIISGLKKIRKQLPARNAKRNEVDRNLKDAGLRIDRFLRGVTFDDKVDALYVYDLKAAISYLGRSENEEAVALRNQITALLENIEKNKNLIKEERQRKFLENVEKPLPEGLVPAKEDLNAENVKNLLQEFVNRLPDERGVVDDSADLLSARRKLSRFIDSLDGNSSIFSEGISLSALSDAYYTLQGSNNAQYLEFADILEKLKNDIEDGRQPYKQEKELAKEEARRVEREAPVVPLDAPNMENRDPEEVAKERVANRENEFAAEKHLQDLLNDEGVYNNNIFIQPFKDELKQFFGDGQPKPLAALSIRSRIALTKLLNDEIRNPSSYEGATQEETDANRSDMLKLILALNEEKLAYEPNRPNLGAGEPLKDMDVTKFYLIAHSLTRKGQKKPVIIDGVDTGFDVQKLNGDGGINAQYTYMIIHRDSGQKFIIKKEKSTGAADGEVFANVVGRALGIVGMPFVDRHNSNDRVIISAFAGDNLRLQDDPVNYDDLPGWTNRAKNAGRMSVIDVIKMNLLDALVANSDRHQRNFMVGYPDDLGVGDNGRNELQIIPVDHGYAHALNGNDFHVSDPSQYVEGGADGGALARAIIGQIGAQSYKQLLDAMVEQMSDRLEELGRAQGMSEADILKMKSRASDLVNIDIAKWLAIEARNA